jgi:hypothetical protein
MMLQTALPPPLAAFFNELAADPAFAAVIAQLLAEPLPASERVDRVATLINLARPE